MNKWKFRYVAYLDNTLGGELGTRNENNLQLSMSGKKSINSKNEYPQLLQRQNSTCQTMERW